MQFCAPNHAVRDCTPRPAKAVERFRRSLARPSHVYVRARLRIESAAGAAAPLLLPVQMLLIAWPPPSRLRRSETWSGSIAVTPVAALSALMVISQSSKGRMDVRVR